VPKGEISSIGVPGLDNLTNDVQIAGDGRRRLSVVPYMKQLFVLIAVTSTLTSERI